MPSKLISRLLGETEIIRRCRLHYDVEIPAVVTKISGGYKVAWGEGLSAAGKTEQEALMAAVTSASYRIPGEVTRFASIPEETPVV